MLLRLIGQAGELISGARGRRGTHLHPFLKQGDFAVIDFSALFLGRHGEFRIGVANSTYQKRFIEIARNHGWTFFAALEHAVARIKNQAALGGVLRQRMALVAMLA